MEDVTIKKTSGSSVIQMKLTTLVGVVAFIFTTFGSVAGFLYRDYTSKDNQIDEKYKEQVEKMGETVNEMSKNVFFIKGQISNVITTDIKRNNHETSEPTYIIPPNN